MTMIHVDVFQDREESVLSPPLVPLSMIVVALAGLLQWLLPIEIMTNIEFIEDIDPDWLAVLGLVIAAAGSSLSLKGYLGLKWRGGAVNPSHAPKLLVTDGAFNWTRNPGYLGILIALSGVALIFAFDWLLIVIVPAWIIVNLAVVRREELYLEHRFGKVYRDYCHRVPRYFCIR
jgi:protein-S-isoprenylcysteine O-methyltransferase Ste14